MIEILVIFNKPSIHYGWALVGYGQVQAQKFQTDIEKIKIESSRLDYQLNQVMGFQFSDVSRWVDSILLLFATERTITSRWSCDLVWPIRNND